MSENDPGLVEAVARAHYTAEAEWNSEEELGGWRALPPWDALTGDSQDAARAGALAAIAAVRAWDADREPLSTQTIEQPGCAPIVTLVWPRGRADALWVSSALIEALVHRVEVREVSDD